MRRLIRQSLIALAIVLTSPWWVWTRLTRALTGGDATFVACSEFFSLMPGRIGIYLRRGYYAYTLEAFATDCQIAFGTTFSHSRVRIEPEVVIGKNCLIGRVRIGTGTALGSNIDILSGRHQHSFGGDGPVQYQAGTYTQLDIGEHCWIGNSAVLIADVGAGAVIGAGSVVVHAIPARVVAVGNPAIVKKQLPSQAA